MYIIRRGYRPRVRYYALLDISVSQQHHTNKYKYIAYINAEFRDLLVENNYAREQPSENMNDGKLHSAVFTQIRKNPEPPRKQVVECAFFARPQHNCHPGPLWIPPHHG